MLCKKCDSILCDSTDIRLIQQCQYVSVDDRIWARCNALPRPNEEIRAFHNLAIPGKIYCVDCMTALGNVIKYSEVYFPSLKADALVLVRKDESGSTRLSNKSAVKKWKKIVEGMFRVEDIERGDVLVMSKNPPDSKDALDKLLESAGA